MKIKKLIILIVIVLLLIGGAVAFMVVSLKPVSNTTSEVTFEVAPNTSKIDIVKNLKSAGLIKNELAALVYVFFNSNLNLQAGSYKINKANSTQEIIGQIADGRIIDIDQPLTRRNEMNIVGKIICIPDNNTEFVSVFKN